MGELNIPDSWVEVKLGEISERIHYGGTASASRAGRYKFLRITDLTENGVDWDLVPFCSLQGGDKYIVQHGDIVIARTGGTVGKSYRIQNPPTNAIFASYLIKISPIELFRNSKFLMYYLDSPFYWSQIKEKAQGSAQPNVNATNLSEIPISLPPYSEQLRIVKKMESIFEKINSIEKNLQKLEKLFEKLSLSYLNADGAWLEFITLEALTEERVEKIGIKNPLNRKIGVDNELGVLDLRVTGKNSFEKYKIVKNGDILYNPMRINVGSLALYHGTEDAITSPDYIVFKVKKNYSKWLIFKYLKSNFGSEEISKKLTGSVRERLYYKKLKDIQFPNPVIERHLEAEKLLSCIYAQIISNKVLLKNVIQKLRESILTKAFEGRLVDQIQDEGTGQKLLEEISFQKNVINGKVKDSDVTKTLKKKQKHK